MRRQQRIDEDEAYEVLWRAARRTAVGRSAFRMLLDHLDGDWCLHDLSCEKCGAAVMYHPAPNPFEPRYVKLSDAFSCTGRCADEKQGFS